MTCLSVFGVDGPATVVANPIYPLQDFASADKSGVYAFEVLDTDAEILRSIIGQNCCFAIDDNLVWGKVATLEPVLSSHPALGLLKHRHALLGTLAIVPDLTIKYLG